MDELSLTPNGKVDLRNIRLVSKQLRILAEEVLFRHIILPLNAEALQQVMPILLQPHIAMRIRAIQISAECMVPSKSLVNGRTSVSSEWECEQVNPDENRRKTFYPHFGDTQYETISQQWIGNFRKQMVELVQACQHNLQAIRVRAILADYETNELDPNFEYFDHDRIQQHKQLAGALTQGFCGAIIEILSIYNLPRLSKLCFDTEELTYIPTQKLSHSSTNSALAGNLSRLSHTCVMHSTRERPVGKPHDNEINNIVEFATGLEKLRSLRMSLNFCLTDGTLPINNISLKPNLSTLSLASAILEGSLSTTINELRKLQYLKMNMLTLNRGIDTWEEVYNTCMNLPHLKQLGLAYPLYQDLDSNEYCAVSSPIVCCLEFQDTQAARKLLNHMDMKHAEGIAFKCVWVVCSNHDGEEEEEEEEEDQLTVV